jgi:hypothetical protein
MNETSLTEGAAPVHLVECTGLGSGQSSQARRPQHEAFPLQVGQHQTGLAALDGVRLDDAQRQYLRHDNLSRS